MKKPCRNEAQDKVETVLSQLNTIKFKSPTIISEIRKYENSFVKI
jgi:hypothetical protein